MPLRIVIDVRHIKDFGIGTYIRNLVQALGGIDPDNHYSLTVGKDEAAELGRLPKNFETVLYGRSDTEVTDDVSYPFFVRSLAPDIVHIPISRVPFFLGGPYVVTVHDLSSLLFSKSQGGWREELRLYHYRRGLMRASRIIAVSAATKRDLENTMAIPADRLRLIYSAPDPRFSDHSLPAATRAAGPDAWAQEQRRILERYQIHYPFLLYAGRISPQKNIPRMVEAFAVLKGELDSHPAYRDLRLIIIGDEISREPAVRRAVIQTRVEQSVRFLGFVPFDTLRVFYGAASAFLFPSLYEGFGLPPLEAMASGTPVVTSNVSSLPEVVGDAAVMVNPENVFDLARAMREVLLDEDFRRRLVARGHEQLKRFSWKRTAQEVLEVYREAARA